MDCFDVVRDGGRESAPALPASAPGGTHTQRIHGLDGLRAIAIGAVLLFHADLYWARGGYLGVDLFFVLSGFLITGLLADEIEQTGRLSLTGFYWRRAKRLLPAVWLMMAGVTAVAAVIAPDALPRLRGDALASLVYLTNWELLGVHVSYFEAMGRPPLLQHLWSLAIEEQFYIVWAIVVPAGLMLMGRRALAVVAALLAVASAGWMAIVAAQMGYPGHGDPSRLYFGTDTHAFGLLLGAALGLIWQPARAARVVAALPRALGWLAGLMALALLLALFGQMGEETETLYPWGFLLAAATSLVLIATVSHPGLGLGRWLDAGPMRWIGQRSYGIYLWHWPVFMLTRPGIDLRSWDASTVLGLRLALSIGIAALSYRYIEMPIRSGALERLLAARREKGARIAGLALIVVLALGVSVGALSNAPPQSLPASDVSQALHLDTPPSDHAGPRAVSAPVTDADLAVPVVAAARVRATQPNAPHATKQMVPTRESLQPGTLQVNVQPVLPLGNLAAVATDAGAQPDAAPIATYTGHELTAVGDSVLLGSSQLLGITLHDVDVHATVGWQAADILDQVKALHDAGSLRPAVLVHLGTNGYVTESQLRQILSQLRDCKRVVLVNTHVPRRWMEANNLMIDRVAADFPNVVVVRWSDVSEGQPDFFVSDGVHLTDLGQRAFIANIMRAGHLVPDAAKVADTARTPDAANVAEPAKVPVAAKVTGRASIDPGRDYGTGSGDLSSTLVLAPRPAAPDTYWQKMAQCETDASWSNPGAHSGGLAIAQEDWTTWGGEAFAKTPAEATPAQQIEIANRISTQGWTQPDGSLVKPIGFAGWRCVAALPPPAVHPGDDSALAYTPDSVVAQSFHLGERGAVVRDLQILLGAPHDGIYSKATRRRHLAYLQKNGLPEQRAGE